MARNNTGDLAHLRDRLAAPATIFIVNVWVVWRLFFVEYLDQLPSVEGEFIAMARYVRRHWPGYDWQSLWHAGSPVTRIYQPLTHYAVAVLAATTGHSAAAAYHFVAALSYALGGAAFYYLAKALCGSKAVAFAGALCFSSFSPSALLFPAIRNDAGGLWNARRLQVLVVYGELPNLTGLMLGMFALALLHRALQRRTTGSALACAMVLAAVPATNWPATLAVLCGALCYLSALRWDELRAGAGRISLIGGMTVAFALPFALPSTIFSTYGNANAMAELPAHDVRRWTSEALLVGCFLLLRWLLTKSALPFGLRFAALWTGTLGWVLFSSALAGIAILPQPMRFHIAFEIPFILTAVLLFWHFGARSFTSWEPRSRRCAAAFLAVFCCFQIFHYRRHARSMIRKLDIVKTVEYQEAMWFDANMHGERVLAPGTVQFWMNAFTDTPQMDGCCDQSVMTHEDTIAAYVTAAGYRSDVESADYSLLWMKAFAVHAVAIGGPQSREWYKPFDYPKRFQGRLPLEWWSGDDFIYRVPERVPGLARVVRRGDLIRHAPTNGIDVAEMRPFVAALDDPSLPAASSQWTGPNSASIHATLGPEHVVAVALNYHPGWSATVEGKPVPVHPDGLSFVVIEPGCSGPCTVELRWSPGREPWVAAALALLVSTGAAGWALHEMRARRRANSGLRPL